MINAHIHIFNYHFIPEDFLKVRLDGILGSKADFFLRLLSSKAGRKLLKILGAQRLFPKVTRYAEFLNVGLFETQDQLLQHIDKSYQGLNTSYVLLTLNMDYMSDQGLKGGPKIETQLAEIMDIKRRLGNKVYPFLSIDPRHLGGAELDAWIKQKWATGYFSGFKIYPALGFYPFDERLKPMWEFANANKLPVTTHCTRFGVNYIGSGVWNLIGTRPLSVNPDPVYMQPIYERIQRYRNYQGPARKDIQGNAWACNLFSHPSNYEPILVKYPDIKLCLAHFGGAEEVLAETLFKGKTEDEVKMLDNGVGNAAAYISWFELIKIMMAKYPNCWTDISYTLENTKTFPRLSAVMKSPIADRVLFGTDFFMELQDKDESTVLRNFLNAPDFSATEKLQLYEVNTHRFV
ncbi:MAG: amidohydrolase family protein [Bacteroidia bacterium]|nr:amidohydrolase family protein [Bacteroidia bacterium]